MGFFKDPAEALEKEWAHHRREVRRLHQKLFYRPLLTAVARIPGPEARLSPEAAAGSAGGRHAEMTRAILRGYDLTEPDRTHAVRPLGSVFHGFVSLEAAGGFSHSAPDSQESWERILDALDALLRNWPAPPTPERTG